MQPINLLPKDLTPRKSVLKLSGTIKRISIIGFSFLLVSVIVTIGVVYMLSRQVNASKERQQELIAKINSYEQTEQQLILVKDRLDKSSVVLGANTAAGEIENFDQLLQLFPPESRLEQAGMNYEGTNINLIVQSSSALVELFANLISSNLYQSVKLVGFNYNSQSGYHISLSLKT